MASVDSSVLRQIIRLLYEFALGILLRGWMHHGMRIGYGSVAWLSYLWLKE